MFLLVGEVGRIMVPQNAHALIPKPVNIFLYTVKGI